MNKKTIFILLLLTLVVAAFLRFYKFTSYPPGLFYDEAIDGNNAATVAQTGHFQTFYVEDNGREGLYINIIAILLKYFNAPHEPWVIRLPAAISGTLTVLGLYLLVAELFGVETALLAAFLLATSFWHINFSRIGFRAIMAPLLLTWSLYLLMRSIKSEKKVTAITFAIISGIVYGLGFYTYIAYRITPLLFLLFIPYFKKYPEFWKRVLVFVITIFVIAAPIGWYFLKHPSDFFGRTSEISVTNSGNPLAHFALNLGKTLLMFNVHGDYNWRHNLSGAPELFWPVGILFILGNILGLIALYRYFFKKNIGDSLPAFSLLVTFFWFILAILPAAASDEGLPHALRSILMLPPAIILAALGGRTFYEYLRKYISQKVLWAGALIFFLILFAQAYYTYFVVWGQNENTAGAFATDYVALGRQLNSLLASTPKYVIVKAGGVLVNGIPMPAETTIFITDTFSAENQKAKNIYYVLPENEKDIPLGALKFYIN